ncbi:YhcH/YjgK/YiaL family protein [Cohaesibacter celericrescens]|uniref:YhcH/YjgK/YiaL family protein n=1 Tax=Cohaesibacter celericrescens TaxID=2067669 RepID=UPI003565FB46
MIYGRLDNLAVEAVTLPKKILKGLQFLKETDLAAAPEGRIDIDGENMFALVQDYATKPKSDARPETHVRYIDIQFVFSGEEAIGFAPLATVPPAIEDCLAERDVRFYDDGISGETSLIMSAGSYAVFYPWDVHRPGCSVSDATDVRKVVVKILM